MHNFYRIMLGRKSALAERCFTEGFIGADYDYDEDLTGKLPAEFQDFNRAFRPIYLKSHPHKTKIAAGLAASSIWTLSKGILIGDVVISPDGDGGYRVGTVVGDYYYVAGDVLPHRRRVEWQPSGFRRDEMSEALRNSTGSTGTVCNITSYRDELSRLIRDEARETASPLISTDPDIEDVSAFAMESHLESFLIENWSRTELGRDYDIYEEDGEKVGVQLRTDTGPLDILAISKDKQRLLVVELKKGRASDAVVGQTLRYMGFVQSELAETGQTVRGAIIALEDDQRIRRALCAVPSVDFYRYQIHFRLLKTEGE